MKPSTVKEHKFKGKREYLADMREFIQNALSETPLPSDDIDRMILACDETCANIISHNYEENSAHTNKDIEITVKHEDNLVSVTIIDEGDKFNPLDMHDPDLKQHLEEYRKSGLGLYLIRRLVDEIEYHYIKNKGNHLELIKYTDICELV